MSPCPNRPRAPIPDSVRVLVTAGTLCASLGPGESVSLGSAVAAPYHGADPRLGYQQLRRLLAKQGKALRWGALRACSTQHGEAGAVLAFRTHGRHFGTTGAFYVLIALTSVWVWAGSVARTPLPVR